MFRASLKAPGKEADALSEGDDFTPPPYLRYCDEVVTLQDMRLALRAALGGKGVSQPDTDKLADYLMNFFGFEDCMIDNVLDAEDRDVFYTLEEEGLLRTEREEIYLLKGKMWRIHYWILRKREILALARERVERSAPQEDSYASVYDQVDDETWASRSMVSENRNGSP